MLCQRPQSPLLSHSTETSRGTSVMKRSHPSDRTVPAFYQGQILSLYGAPCGAFLYLGQLFVLGAMQFLLGRVVCKGVLQESEDEQFRAYL